MNFKNNKILLIACFLLQISNATGQYTIDFIVSVPEKTGEVYLAASFNDWSPNNENYKLASIDKKHKEIKVHNLKAGKYEFRFTQGIWENSECSSTGVGIENRSVIINKDTIVRPAIEGWVNAYFDMSHLSDSALNEAMMARAGYYLEVNLDSSYKYAVQLYEISKRLHVPSKEARALGLQALIFTRQGDGQKALELLFKSLEIQKTLKDSSGISFIYNAIGRIYESLRDYIRAKENYQKAVDWTEIKFQYYESVGLINIGNIFFKTGHFDSALHYAEKALQFDDIASGSWMLMGNIYKKTNRQQLAMLYYKKATHPGIPFRVIAEAYKNISEIFKEANQTDSAFFYARMAFALAGPLKNPDVIISTGSSLIELFKDDGKFDSAFFYQDIVLKAKDSLFTQEKERQKHNIYLNETLRQQEMQAQDEKYSSRIKIFALAGVSVLLLLAGLGYRARLRTRFYKQLSKIEMRALRAQMSPHFIFNCLASINRYIVKSDTKTASGYLTKFSKLIRLILDNSSNELISLDAEIQTLKLYLDMESLRFDHSFDYKIQHDEISRTDNTAIPTMIIQPYIENAIWHGLLHKEQKGQLSVRFHQLSEDVLQVEIEDNGIGRMRAAELRSKDTIKTKSYGMQISKDRIRIINTQHRIQSSVTIEDLSDSAGNAGGTKVILHLPLIEMAANSSTINKAV